jgi:membrane-bound serine protease (ClpP class)
MSVLIVFFALGIILLALEIVTPGPLCGIAGCICMVLGVIKAFAMFGSLGGALAVLLALAALAAVVYLEFVWLPRSRLVKKFSMNTTLHATSQPLPAVPADVVGREAVAETTLAPGGYVRIEDRRYEAFCRSGHAPVGARLKVVGLDNFRLIVSKT